MGAWGGPDGILHARRPRRGRPRPAAPTDGWLAGQGVACRPVESSECGVVYYSRYFRQRPGFELPDGPWLLSPRGDLGYLGYATFPGDSRTFAAILAVPTGVPAWRAFRDAGVFATAVERIPALCSWVDPDGVEPITDVLAMANLHNTLRDAAAPSSVGVVPAGGCVRSQRPRAGAWARLRADPRP